MTWWILLIVYAVLTFCVIFVGGAWKTDRRQTVVDGVCRKDVHHKLKVLIEPRSSLWRYAALCGLTVAFIFAQYHLT